jgi:hypothetical protein
MVGWCRRIRARPCRSLLGGGIYPRLVTCEVWVRRYVVCCGRVVGGGVIKFPLCVCLGCVLAGAVFVGAVVGIRMFR